MLRAEWAPYNLDFRFTAVTSRERMKRKSTYFVRVYDTSCPEVKGLGECALFRGLSADDVPDYEAVLTAACRDIERFPESVPVAFSSIKFGLETAMADLRSGGVMKPYPGAWADGKSEIVINGLVWMGTRDEMHARIREKLEAGFRCVKLKIGGIDFDRELELLRGIRESFDSKSLEIRLDANGAFTPSNAMERLEALARFDIHSIEQPIKQRQWKEMAYICRQSPIPVALDEELIGITDKDEKERMLDAIAPQYVILKPALCGGFSGADEWIELAGQRNIGWWATSALESNIGLNAISQWVSQKNPVMPQGLGTGALYHNNIPSPLRQERDVLLADPSGKWDLTLLDTLEWN